MTRSRVRVGQVQGGFAYRSTFETAHDAPQVSPLNTTISGSWLRWAVTGASARRRSRECRASTSQVSSWHSEATGSPVRSSAARKAHCAAITTRSPAASSSTDWWPGVWPEDYPVREFLVSVNPPQSVLGDRRPVRHRVARCLGRLELGGLHVDRGSQNPLLTTVVEMQMRHDHRGDIGGCDSSSAEGVEQRCYVWVVPLGDHFVAHSDTGVYQYGAVRMPNKPSMDRKGLERVVLGVPLWHRGYGRQDQTVNLRQRRESHGQQPTCQGAPVAGLRRHPAAVGKLRQVLGHHGGNVEP